MAHNYRRFKRNWKRQIGAQNYSILHVTLLALDALRIDWKWCVIEFIENGTNVGLYTVNGRQAAKAAAPNGDRTTQQITHI